MVGRSSVFLGTDEFLGASSSSRLDFTPPPEEPPRTPLSDSAPASPTSPLPENASCGSLTPPTQVERSPEVGVTTVDEGGASGDEGGASGDEGGATGPPPEELTRRMSEAGLGGREDAGTAPTPPTETDHAPKTRDGNGRGGASDEAAAPRPAPPRTDTVREEGAQDLRVFELNSDSGKSTPSNNGKKGETQSTPTHSHPKVAYS